MDDRSPLTFEVAQVPPGACIGSLLATLKEAGAERFDAAGWHYLDTLAKRAATHDGSVRHMLETKIERAVEALSDRLTQARGAAAQLLDAACQRHPQAATQLQQVFAQNDFKALRRMCASLDAHQQFAALDALVTQLEPALSDAPAQLPGSAAAPLAEVVQPALELKTVRESRATWARMSVDKQLALAMHQAPQNAGPINSHMLVLRSLAMMQGISPDYLSRVVSYIDTLLSLDPGEPEVPAKKKKASPAKVAKPAKTSKK